MLISAFTCMPQKFECKFRPRSEQRVQVAEREFEAMDKNMSQLMS